MNDHLHIQLTEDHGSELKKPLNQPLPQKKKSTKSKAQKKDHKVVKKEVEITKGMLSVDLYSIFKQLAPLIPLFPALYQMIRSLLNDKTDSVHATVFKILDIVENLNISLYSIFSTLLYTLFKKSKYIKEKLRTRRRWAETIRKTNNWFLVFVIIVSALKFILGCFLPKEGETPDDAKPSTWIINLISQLGLIVAELFYLYSVFIKKFYKFEEELEEIASWGIENPENHKKNLTTHRLRRWLHWRRKRQPEDAVPVGEQIKDQEAIPIKLKEEIKEADRQEPEKKTEDEAEEEEEESEDDLEELKQSLEANNQLTQTVLEKLQNLERGGGSFAFPGTEKDSQSELMVQYLRAISKGSNVEILDIKTNDTFIIEAKLNDTVADVKLRIKDKLRLFTKNNLALFVGQIELKDEKLLIEYDLAMHQPRLTYNDDE